MVPKIAKLTTILLAVVLFFACSKDTSFETGSGINGTAAGTLLDSSGNCQNTSVKGMYAVDTVLTDSNYVLLQVNITTPGKYNLSTDTMNGFWFQDSSYVLTTGAQTIKLKGYGKPILPINPTFTIFFGNSFCQFTVQVNGAVLAGGTNGDYFPTTANSYWVYLDSQLNDTIRTVCTGLTQNFNSNTYNLFVDAVGDSSYYRKSNGTYYQYGRLYDSTAPVEYIFLKDNAAAGSTWDSPIINFNLSNGGVTANINLKYHFTVAATNTTTTVNGTPFSNVIKMQVDVMAIIPPSTSYQTYQTSYYYYAKGVGLVDQDWPATSSSSAYSSTIVKWQVF